MLSFAGFDGVHRPLHGTQAERETDIKAK